MNRPDGLRSDCGVLVCFFVATLSGIVAGGCETSHNAVVTSTSPPPLLHYAQYSPRVYVETADGQATRVGKLGGPFYVVAFVEPPGTDDCYIDPRVRQIAGKLYLDSIPVIQVTLPTKLCPLKPDRQGNCPPPTGELYRVLDPDKRAWEAYHKPKPGTVLLIDRQSIIPIVYTRATLADAEKVIDRAGVLQADWEQFQRSTY